MTAYGQIVSTLKGLCLVSVTTYIDIEILKPFFEQSLDIVSNLKIVFQYFI